MRRGMIFPPPLPNEPPVNFTTAEVGKTVTDEDIATWIAQNRGDQAEDKPGDPVFCQPEFLQDINAS